jgi:hypothetical protein
MNPIAGEIVRIQPSHYPATFVIVILIQKNKVGVLGRHKGIRQGREVLL